MLRYAISDRRLFPGSEADRLSGVVEQAARLASQGVNYFQVREKDLAPAALLRLAIAVRCAVEANGPHTHVVLNGAPELAEAAGVGVHLPYRIWSAHKPAVGTLRSRVTSISCHSADEVEAAAPFADVLLFAPVFEKRVVETHVRTGSGLAALSDSCSRSAGVPVVAMGGVTAANAPECIAAGASGVAGIRLFLE